MKGRGTSLSFLKVAGKTAWREREVRGGASSNLAGGLEEGQ